MEPVHGRPGVGPANVGQPQQTGAEETEVVVDLRERSGSDKVELVAVKQKIRVGSDGRLELFGPKREQVVFTLKIGRI